MQFKKKFEQEQSLAGLEQAVEGLEQASAGFEQGSANYLGSNRILRGSWPHGPPSLSGLIQVNDDEERNDGLAGRVYG